MLRPFTLTIAISLLSAQLLSCAAKYTAVPESDFDKAAITNATLGTAYLRKNMLDQAQFKLERALSQRDDLPLAHSSYALLMARLGKKKKARKHFKRALSLDDNDPDTLNNFATFLCDEGEVEEALEYFERAYTDTLYKSPEIALANAGICLSKTDRRQESIEYIERAIEINPSYGEGHFQLAFVYYHLKQNQRAKAYLNDFHDRFGYQLPSLKLGIQIARELKDKAYAERMLGVMSRKYSHTKDYHNAIRKLKEEPIR